MIPDLARHTEKLHHFFEIVQEGSLQATSRKLNISAATLSYSLKELEAATGVTLLLRSKKGISPTPAGKRLHDFCRKLYRDLDQIQLQISDLEHSQKTRIRIGTFSTIAIHFWPLMLDELKKEDSLSLSITTKRSKDILESLMKKENEISITVGSFNNPSIIKHELYRDSFAFYTHVKDKRKSYHVEELSLETLLYIPDAEDDKGKNLRYHIHEMGLKFKEEFELDSLEVIAEFIKRGYGIGILPTKVAANLKSTLKKISIAGVKSTSFAEHCFYLSYRTDLEISQKDLKIIMQAATKAVQKNSL